ncbi:hypothetical protein ABZZ04_10290 [Streptomyces sp. NPDC006435]|uniref:hypothetical protein n=1 Tax=Streptomyces sp. NPDC006435 TaxID=3154300 RepID=UPI0033AA0135
MLKRLALLLAAATATALLALQPTPAAYADGELECGGIVLQSTGTGDQSTGTGDQAAGTGDQADDGGKMKTCDTSWGG